MAERLAALSPEGPPEATILNVNDDEANRYVITRTLRKAGLAVREAATGTDALRLAADRPDLIVLDVDLPDLDGFEVCRRLKADPTSAAIPVLHLSAKFVRCEDRVHGLEGGADGYLIQPFEPPELVATVRSLIRLRRAEQTAARQAQDLREQHQLLHAIATHAPAALFLTDAGGRVTFLNPAAEAMFGWSPEELLGRALHDAVHHRRPDGAPFAIADCPLERATAAGEGVRDLEDLFFRKDGTSVAVSCSSAAIVTAGRVTGAVLLVVDVTGRKRAEAAEAAARASAERVRHLEQEIEALERLAGRPPAGPTASGAASLGDADPAAFGALARDYGGLMERALEQRHYRVTHDISAGLRALGERLGALGAGPRDVIELHGVALGERRRRATPARVRAYLEEGRILLVELMGVLAAHYRRHGPAGAVRPSPGDSWPAGIEEAPPHG